MLKIISTSLILFIGSISFANSSEIVIPSDNFKSEIIPLFKYNLDSVKFYEANNLIASELPNAVLRLHDLKEVNFRGEILLRRSPLELAKLKSPIKTA